MNSVSIGSGAITVFDADIAPGATVRGNVFGNTATPATSIELRVTLTGGPPVSLVLRARGQITRPASDTDQLLPLSVTVPNLTGLTANYTGVFVIPAFTPFNQIEISNTNGAAVHVTAYAASSNAQPTSDDAATNAAAAAAGASMAQVGFNATTLGYVVPAGMKVSGVWLRPGAGGGGGGGGGGAGASASTGGGGGGGCGAGGGSCGLERFPVSVASGTALDITIGAGGTGGAGGAAGSAGTAGNPGGETSIAVSGGAALIRAVANNIGSSPTLGNGGTAGGAGAVGTGAGGAGGSNGTGSQWPGANGNLSNTPGAGGGASTPGAVGTAQPTRVVASRTMYINTPTGGASGAGGTADATRGGGGAGACGGASLPGDEFISVLGIAMPPATGAGSGRGAPTSGAGGNGNNAGAGVAGGAPPSPGSSGSLGRGGGGGAGGGGGGAGSTTGGAGGAGTAGGDGSAGAVILELVAA